MVDISKSIFTPQLPPLNPISAMQLSLYLLALTVSSVCAHISVIQPDGNREYEVGDNMTITWTNEGYDPATPISFELADASKGVNKVTPINVYLGHETTIGQLQMMVTVPESVPNGAAYCVRADVKGTKGFEYYFSPNFPIGMPLQSSSTASIAPATTGTSSSNGNPSSAKAGNAQVASSAAPTKQSGAPSGYNVVELVLMVLMGFLF
ncbi:hypothetical protein BC830DRAFT_1157987 [Chytriomyces sp. MP71]|nr:hypothetical protein BC830DRAFT_1157987 [Chytriomyces sp. MP71]